MKNRRFLSYLAWAALAPSVATASDATKISLGSGTQSCPTKSAIAAEIRGNHSAASPVRVEVTMAATGPSRWRADVVMTEPGGPRFVRQMELAGTCADLVAATSVAVRLALDRPTVETPVADVPTQAAPLAIAEPQAPFVAARPAALGASALPPPVSARPKAPFTTAAVPLAPAELAAAPLPPSAPPTAPSPTASATSITARADRSPDSYTRWDVGLALGAASGFAPDLAPQLRATAGKTQPQRSWLAEVAFVAPTTSATLQGPLSVWSLMVGAVPCWRVRPLSLCAAVHVGVMSAAAEAVKGADTGVSPLALAGTRIELDLFQAGAWSARLDCGGGKACQN